MKAEEAGALADSMLKDKQRELKAAKSPDIAGAVLPTGVGTIAGFTVGIATVIAGAFAHGISVFKRVASSHPETFQRLEQMNREAERTGGKITPEMEKTIAEFTDRFSQGLQHESNTLGGNIVKHPGGWVAGLTAAGAGLGVLWQMKRQNQKIEAAQQEVDRVQHLRDSWQEQIATKAKPGEAAEQAR